jgi:hypothetical protein
MEPLTFPAKQWALLDDAAANNDKAEEEKELVREKARAAMYSKAAKAGLGKVGQPAISNGKVILEKQREAYAKQAKQGSGALAATLLGGNAPPVKKSADTAGGGGAASSPTIGADDTSTGDVMIIRHDRPV